MVRTPEPAASGIASFTGKPADFAAAVQPVVARELQNAGLNPALVPAIVSQLALETGYGKSVPGGNVGGVKADKSWKGPTQTLQTTEFIDGREVRVPQTFRAYASPEEGIADQVRFLLNNPRYRQALAASTPQEFFKAVAAAGYATDPHYSNKLLSVHNNMFGR